MGSSGDGKDGVLMGDEGDSILGERGVFGERGEFGDATRKVD